MWGPTVWGPTVSINRNKLWQTQPLSVGVYSLEAYSLDQTKKTLADQTRERGGKKAGLIMLDIHSSNYIDSVLCIT